jgi:hypothetical protein
MKRLTPWIVAGLVVLAVLMTWVGWDERHEAGILPFVIGLAWLAIALASVGRIGAPESD